ncbi:hypothetical protein BDA99DRAFT_120330 [Phascolomyces articulosus]|uniref:F-box domain-containing protein n=1 Tax=Phascolomyces articulosus TaxID=60185 RepID=A0AAD5PJJ5_9FUNG|nr:hypothetical protein BDA99DRAFT_120330 [Phascolomyces articulosus]
MTASILSPFSTTAKPGDSMLTLTHLDITTTQRAFEQGKQAYASQNYSQAIDLYTHALDLLQSELESVILLHRATAHEKRKEYHRAADDAKRANPYNNLTRPDPYLVGANIFLLQKRWHEAANVYKRGAILVPNTYRERSVLTDNYQHLTMVIHKNNQWIAEVLPYEVVSQILSYMSTTDCVRLASTCHFWRNFILQQQGSSSLWYTLHIAEMMTKTAIGPFLYSIPADKPRMITLKRTDKDNLSLLDGVSAKILGIVNDRRWDNLESIGMGLWTRSTVRKYS